MIMCIIRRAKPAEASTLSDLALRSKAHWGYSDQFIKDCRAELTYTAMQISDDKRVFYIAEKRDFIIGFYGLCRLSWDSFELDALFIEPSAIKQGLGRSLFFHAKNMVASLQGKSILIQSDPNAEGFYLSLGCEKIGEKPSDSIPDRLLPLLKFSVL